MRHLPLRTMILLGLGLLLGGCASFNAQVEHGRSLAGIERFYVVRNLNDNHAFDHQIVAALQARGLTAEAGPLTMMPENTQAIVSFQDHWAWDFRENLVYLKINIRDTRSEQVFATVTFDARFPVRLTTAEIVGKLVDRLLQPKAK